MLHHLLFNFLSFIKTKFSESKKLKYFCYIGNKLLMLFELHNFHNCFLKE